MSVARAEQGAAGVGECGRFKMQGKGSVRASFKPNARLSSP